MSAAALRSAALRPSVGAAPAEPIGEAGSLAVELRAAPAADEAPTALRAFRAICNLRNLSAVFYFCVLVAVARFLQNLALLSFEEWVFSTIRFVRQCLISGALIMVALALAEAVGAGRDWSRRRAFIWAFVAVSVAAALSVVVRYYVSDSPLTMLVSPPNVTWCSCIASSRADCTFGGARLISSARSTLAKIGPRRGVKSQVRWL